MLLTKWAHHGEDIALLMGLTPATIEKHLRPACAAL